MVANITATLDISKSIDNEGKEITPAFEVISSFVRWVVPYTRSVLVLTPFTSHPKPFLCSIRPRSEKATSLIHDAKL
jgi:hypothetical protein